MSQVPSKPPIDPTVFWVLFIFGTFIFFVGIQIAEKIETVEYNMAVTCNPNAPPAVGANRRTVFSQEHFDLDAIAGSHPPLHFEEWPGGFVENARLYTAREGSCLKVGVYSAFHGYIVSTYYVQAPDFDIQGMAASPLPNRENDVKLENGTVLPRIRHGEAMGAILLTSNSKEGDTHIRWVRIHGNYYYIETFRGGDVIVSGIFTEKNTVDLRPYLGDSTQKLDLHYGGSFGADMGDTRIGFYQGEKNNRSVQEIILTPVKREDLPPDFLPDALYWLP